VLSVVSAPGSDSEPGQRNTGIVWQGFSPGRRVLAARASLDPLAAERGLPLEVEVERRANTTAVRLIDIARRRVQITRGSARADRLQPIRQRVAAGLARADRIALARRLQIEGSPAGAGTVVVDLPLRVRGTITADGVSPRRISVVLGKGQPLSRTLTIPRGAAPRLDLRVDPLRPEELLPSRAELVRAKDPLRLMQVALARVALANQYAQYLASPDPLGLNRTSYVYRTAAERAGPPEVQTGDGGGSDALAIVLAAVLGGAALTGLALWWAHS
jgi:hypothetical protein